EIEMEPVGPDRIRVIVRVEERPVIRSLEFEGLKKLDRTEIEERMDEKRIDLREGMPLALGDLKRLQSELESMYREKGFRFARVRYELEEVSPGERRVVFQVDEGNKVKIEEVEFEGNTVFSDYRLKWALRKTRPSGPISRILKRDVFNPANYQEDIDRVRDLYREKGYKNVAIGEPELEVRALRPDAPPAKQKRRLFITIPIDEGERFRYGEVTIRGNEVFSDEVLLRAFSKPRGKWLKASAVDEGVEAVDKLYRNAGYIYSQVDVTLEERGEDVADIVVEVVEGEQYKVGRLEFEGNDRTRDKVLRREFRVHEGRTLNMGALRNSLFKLNQLRYFELDEDNPIEFENIDPEEKTVDLKVQGQEADRTELLFGGGWSELDGFFGQFSLRTQNFRGRGETLSVAVQTGRVTERYELSYFVPWILDRPQSAGFSAFSRELDFFLFGDQRQIRRETGGSLTYGRNFKLFQAFRISYGYTELEDQVFFGGTSDEEGEEGPTNRLFNFEKSTLSPIWIYDSVDNRLEPTRGIRSTVSFDYSGGFLGGNVSFYRPEAEFTYYRPITGGRVRTVFGVNAEAGWLEPFGDEDFPLLERYYRGGARSVRGFANRSLFLRDGEGNPIRDEFGNIVGGTQYFELGLEYQILLGGPFRLVFFTDAGNVFDDDFGRSFDIDELRYTTGVELRLFVPVFGLPLRFIYAENLDPLPGDRFESFQFDVGTSF
ncbi:MAG: outer membrane protein assembly factor BamA, partial [Thermoanaerobaculia bacterium]|nr:outer membrane protein assembly factor BamA [Thermoanaerobaculia bacterium]